MPSTNFKISELVYCHTGCHHIAAFNCVHSFLHVDFLRSSSSPKPSTKHLSTGTVEPNNSIEHSAVQKGSVQCTVGAVGVSCLLSPLWNSSGFVGLHRTSVSGFSSGPLLNHIGIFKFVLKSSYLLLED